MGLIPIGALAAAIAAVIYAVFFPVATRKSVIIYGDEQLSADGEPRYTLCDMIESGARGYFSGGGSELSLAISDTAAYEKDGEIILEIAANGSNAHTFADLVEGAAEFLSANYADNSVTVYVHSLDGTASLMWTAAAEKSELLPDIEEAAAQSSQTSESLESTHTEESASEATEEPAAAEAAVPAEADTPQTAAAQTTAVQTTTVQTTTAQTTAEPPENASPENATSENEHSITVFVAASGNGTKYHSYSSCSGMKSAAELTLEEAKSLGYSPCSKCW